MSQFNKIRLKSQELLGKLLSERKFEFEFENPFKSFKEQIKFCRNRIKRFD